MSAPSNLNFRLRNVQSKIFQACHALPFAWNKKGKLYALDFYHQARFNQEAILIPAIALFQSSQVFKYVSEGKLNQIGYLLLIWILHLIHCCHTYILIWKVDEYLAFVNGSIQFSQKFAGMFSLHFYLTLT